MTSSSRLPGAGAALRIAAALLVVATILVSPAALHAESRAAEDLTPLALVRAAGIVAVVTGSSDAASAVIVNEPLGGPVEAGNRLLLAGTSEHAAPSVVAGHRYVALLRPTAGEPFEVVGGSFGLIAAPDDDAGAATIGLFRALGRAAADPALDPAPLRAALVGAVTAAAPRGRAGAAHDLWTHPAWLAGATQGEREALVEACRRIDPTEAAAAHLARVLGRLGGPEAGPLLAATVLRDERGLLGEAIGRSLRDLGDDEAIALVGAHAPHEDAAVRLRVAVVLGHTARDAARAPLETLLGDAAVAVRKAAAIGLGRLRQPAAAEALLRRFRGGAGVPAPEADGTVRRALVWALAQCDHADAWEALRLAADGEPDERLRAFAAATLRNPRRSFVR